jgi:hypothetical protein
MLQQTCRLAGWGRRIFPNAQRLDQRQRKVKDDDGPFKGTLIIQSLAEDAGHPEIG